MHRYAKHVFVGGLALVLVLFASQRAHACTCGRSSFVLNPSEGVPHVPELPLIHVSNYATTTLEDDAGTLLALDGIRELEVDGLCGGTFRFLSPLSPLEPDARYTIVPQPELEDPTWVGKNKVVFVAGTESVKRAPVRLELAVTFYSHEPHVSNEAGCADPVFNGRTISKAIGVELHTSSPALLFVTVAMSDPAIGRHSDTGTTWNVGFLDTAAFAGVPMPDEAPGCAYVSVVDASATDLLTQTFCPAIGETTNVTRDVMAVVLPEAEEPHQEAVDGRGCGCRLPRGSSERHGAFLFAGLLGLAYVRRRFSGFTGTRYCRSG